MLFLAIVFSFTEGQPLILWLGVGFGMIYGIPGVYYFILLYQKKIDVDVKNLIQRENLFKISIITLAAVFVLTIIFTEAEILQKMLLAATAINLLFIIFLNLFKMELSIHISALTVLIIFLIYYVADYYLIGLLPLILTAISRYKLHKHTVAELIGGFLSSAIIYICILLL